MDADVLIIGAGPAGSVAAKMLKRLGHRVIVLEKSQFPRFSIGESLLPHCMEFLEQAEMLKPLQAEGFQFKNGAAFACAGQRSEFDFAQQFTDGWTSTYQVLRSRFDQLLADDAAEAGVAIHYRHDIIAVDFSTPGQARLTSQDADGQRHDWSASMVLDASGFGRVLPRLLNLETPSTLAPRHAFATHIEDRIDAVDYDRNKVLIAVHPKRRDIWYWLIPFSNGRASFGTVVPAGYFDQFADDRLAGLQNLAREEPRLAELLQNSIFDTPVNPVYGYSADVKSLFGDGYALLGNAGEFLDPIFSSGITIALKSVALAVPLVDSQLRGETVDWREQFEKPLRRGIDVFRAYVDAWYDGRFQRIVFQANQQADIKAMICSILAGFAWDESNPMTQRPRQKIEAIADVCPAF